MDMDLTQVFKDLPDNIIEAVNVSLYGMFDGSHHKMWVIDQMLRVLLGEERYNLFVAEYNKDEDYEDWDVGIAP